MVMIDGSAGVTFEDVLVIRRTDLVVICRVGARVVAVPPIRMLPGTTIQESGALGRLVLPREVALNLRLV
jgi:hypothetical protein